MSVIIEDRGSAGGAGGGTRRFGHELHERAMFSDDALARLLDAYPRSNLGVFTMGDGSMARHTWRAGAAEGLSGAQLLEAVKTSRLWLNLRAVDRFVPEYKALSDELFADLDARLGEESRTRDLGLLISSPGAQVFYHLDAPLVSLWQLRGRKRMWVYPVEAPYVTANDIERIVLREQAEELPFDDRWDAGAEVVDLGPGEMATWPHNAPHRVENGAMLNVSLSVEFMTATAYRRVNQIYANGLLRRKLGLRPGMSRDGGPASYAKRALTKAASKVVRRRPTTELNPKSFRLDAQAPHGPLPL